MRRVTVTKRYDAGEVTVLALEERYTGDVVEEDEQSLTLGSEWGTMTFYKTDLDVEEL